MSSDPENGDSSGRRRAGLLHLGPPKPEGLNSLLLAAVESGNDEVAAKALADGADPNSQHPETGATALHYAAAYCAHRCLVLLIRSGRCDFLVRDKRGLLPSEVAYEIADDPRAGGLLAKLEARQAYRAGRDLRHVPTAGSS